MKIQNTISLRLSLFHTQRTGNPGVPGNPLSPFMGTNPITPPGSPCRTQNKKKGSVKQCLINMFLAQK